MIFYNNPFIEDKVEPINDKALDIPYEKFIKRDGDEEKKDEELHEIMYKDYHNVD